MGPDDLAILVDLGDLADFVDQVDLVLVKQHLPPRICLPRRPGLDQDSTSSTSSIDLVYFVSVVA